MLASSGGRTAADRAASAADRLNAAAQPLRTTLGLTLEARGLESNPVIGLVGSSEALLEITEEDASAYNEDWTGLRGRGGPVTRARLARWWEALGRDLVLMTVRGAGAAARGRARGRGARARPAVRDRPARAALPACRSSVVDEARPPMLEALRAAGAARAGRGRGPRARPTPRLSPAAAAATPTPPPPLQLEGSWGGSQVEQGQRQYLTRQRPRQRRQRGVRGGITFTVPMLSLEKPRRDQVRFSVQIRGGMRHYAGRWDGETLSGNVSTDAAGKNVVGTFELRGDRYAGGLGAA